MTPERRKRLIKLSLVWGFVLVLGVTILPWQVLVFFASVAVVAGVTFVGLSRWRAEASSSSPSPVAAAAPGPVLPPAPSDSARPPVDHPVAAAPNDAPLNETAALLGLARTTTVATPTRFTPPTLEELGAALPQFTVEALIGSGGMGAVYRVRQKDLDRVAALKVLPRELADKPGFQERFLREAQALAGLSHPHLVTVHDVGQDGGWCWLLMELVDGANLREVMRTGRLSPEQALTLVPQLCDALQYAHDRGVVHRDIKPENILLDGHGRLKLTDFGLAKLLGEPAAGSALTQTGAVLGTVHYMAPEQVEGARSVDHRADIYAVGVVLYEMLTGGLPLGRFQPPSQQIAVDVRVDEVVLKALEKDPERRYQQAREVRRDVESAAASPAPTGTTPTSNIPAKSRTATATLELGGDGEKPQPDRRYVSAVVLAVWGLAVFGERMSAAFAPLVRYQIEVEQGVPLVDQHTQAHSNGSVPLPEIWPLLGALAGLGMVLGAWSLLTLRGRSLAVLGGISALAIGPLMVADLGLYDRYSVPAGVAMLVGAWLLYATARTRMAACFNHAALRAHGLTVPGAFTLTGWSLALPLALIGSVVLGAYAVVRPQVATSLTIANGVHRTMVDDGLSLPADRHPYYADRARQAAGVVESVRGDITALIAVGRQFPKLNRKSADADDDQPSLTEVMQTLETIQRGDDPGDGLRVSRRERVERACQQGSAVATTAALLFQIHQATGGSPESQPLPAVVVSHVERQLLQLKLDLDRLQLYADDLGTVSRSEFRRQVSLLENLTPNRLADPAEEARLREDFARYWYSRHQVDFLLARLREYRAPTATSDWLREVLATRVTDAPPPAAPAAASIRVPAVEVEAAINQPALRGPGTATVSPGDTATMPDGARAADALMNDLRQAAGAVSVTVHSVPSLLLTAPPPDDEITLSRVVGELWGLQTPGEKFPQGRSRAGWVRHWCDLGIGMVTAAKARPLTDDERAALAGRATPPGGSTAVPARSLTEWHHQLDSLSAVLAGLRDRAVDLGSMPVADFRTLLSLIDDEQRLRALARRGELRTALMGIIKGYWFSPAQAVTIRERIAGPLSASSATTDDPALAPAERDWLADLVRQRHTDTEIVAGSPVAKP